MTAEQDAAARELLEIYADILERQHGPCLSGRAALMNWIDAQFLRLAQLNAPDHAAGELIDRAYVLWQGRALRLVQRFLHRRVAVAEPVPHQNEPAA